MSDLTPAVHFDSSSDANAWVKAHLGVDL